MTTRTTRHRRQAEPNGTNLSASASATATTPAPRTISVQFNAGRRPTRLAAYQLVSSSISRKACTHGRAKRSEEHTSELQSLMRISYAVFCLKKKTQQKITSTNQTQNNREKRHSDKTTGQ